MNLGEMIKINQVQITLEIPTSIDASFIMKIGLDYTKTWHPWPGLYDHKWNNQLEMA